MLSRLISSGMLLAMVAAQEMMDISILLRVEIKAVIPVSARSIRLSSWAALMASDGMRMT